MNAKEILFEIGTHLKEHPENWMKGSIGTREGPKCLWGHLYFRDSPIETRGYEVVLAEIQKRSNYRFNTIGAWNDNPNTKVEDIVDVCFSAMNMV